MYQIKIPVSLQYEISLVMLDNYGKTGIKISSVERIKKNEYLVKLNSDSYKFTAGAGKWEVTSC